MLDNDLEHDEVDWSRRRHLIRCVVALLLGVCGSVFAPWGAALAAAQAGPTDIDPAPNDLVVTDTEIYLAPPGGVPDGKQPVVTWAEVDGEVEILWIAPGVDAWPGTSPLDPETEMPLTEPLAPGIQPGVTLPSDAGTGTTDNAAAADLPPICSNYMDDHPSFDGINVKEEADQLCSNVAEHRVKIRLERYVNNWYNFNYTNSRYGATGVSVTAHQSQRCYAGHSQRWMARGQGTARNLSGTLFHGPIFQSNQSTQVNCPK